jgi:hypothetical protein
MNSKSQITLEKSLGHILDAFELELLFPKSYWCLVHLIIFIMIYFTVGSCTQIVFEDCLLHVFDNHFESQNSFTNIISLMFC